MPKHPRTNIKKLADEGYTIKEGLPQEYVDVIEDLRPDEIELIIDVNRKLQTVKKNLPEDQDFQMFMPPF
jgi:hypothetical protein